MMSSVATNREGELEATKGKSNTQQAVYFLKNMIMSNQLLPGSNHLESELAAMLNMSRTPVREAALILEGKGLVQVKPRHGVFINPISADDMREIYEILAELECLSAELAAQRNHPKEAFAMAEKSINDMEEALKENNREMWAAADEDFHMQLVILGGNQRIIQITQMYNDQVRRARLVTLNLRPKPTKSNEDHRNVLMAIKGGDSVGAKNAHEKHRQRSKSIILDILIKYGFHSV